MEKRDSLRRRAVWLLGAAVYALLYALCSQIDEAGVISWETAAVRFTVALPVALAALWVLLRRALPKIEMQPDTAGKKPFCTWGAALLLFCCYVPVFLIEYPGSFVYDIEMQATQIATGEYSRFHPLLHTLLIRACLACIPLLGSLTRALALYSLSQMALVSLCFAGVCASLARSVSRWAAHLTLAFFALYPLHMLFASNCTKDVLFSAFLALFFALCLEDIACGLSRRLRAEQALCGVLACLLRNNMIYAMAAWAALLLMRRGRTRRMALCGLLVLVLAQGANACLSALTGAQGGCVKEMLSVPLQQLARARRDAPECFAQEDLAVLEAVGLNELYQHYDPTIADGVKYRLDDDRLRANLPAFVKTWLSVGGRCPGVYAEAFLRLALPSLYPYRYWQVNARYAELGVRDDTLARLLDQVPVVQPERFAAARAWLQRNIGSTGSDHVPVMRWLFNTGGIFWLLLLLVLYDLYCGRFDRAAVCLLAVLLWGTYLLGPVMQGRYLYPFVCVLPLFVFRRRTESAKT